MIFKDYLSLCDFCVGEKFIPEKMNIRDIWVPFLYAIGLQESQFLARRQYGHGPARGYWQFEEGGGVVGVLRHTATKKIVREACQRLDISPDSYAVWNAIEYNDVLALVFARCLLYTHPKALPTETQPDIGWQQYMDTWRPGKPRKEIWRDCWQQAWGEYQGPG